MAHGVHKSQSAKLFRPATASMSSASFGSSALRCSMCQSVAPHNGWQVPTPAPKTPESSVKSTASPNHPPAPTQNCVDPARRSPGDADDDRCYSRLGPPRNKLSSPLATFTQLWLPAHPCPGANTMTTLSRRHTAQFGPCIGNNIPCPRQPCTQAVSCYCYVSGNNNLRQGTITMLSYSTKSGMTTAGCQNMI